MAQQCFFVISYGSIRPIGMIHDLCDHFFPADSANRIQADERFTIVLSRMEA